MIRQIEMSCLLLGSVAHTAPRRLALRIRRLRLLEDPGFPSSPPCGAGRTRTWEQGLTLGLIPPIGDGTMYEEQRGCWVLYGLERLCKK